ncbi:hypothetical protein L7F22_057952 [Adiantum nelumboides]|nr:hypothetical protein [Adiantum nelumboides]
MLQLRISQTYLLSSDEEVDDVRRKLLEEQEGEERERKTNLADQDFKKKPSTPPSSRESSPTPSPPRQTEELNKSDGQQDSKEEEDKEKEQKAKIEPKDEKPDPEAKNYRIFLDLLAAGYSRAHAAFQLSSTRPKEYMLSPRLVELKEMATNTMDLQPQANDWDEVMQSSEQGLWPLRLSVLISK